MQRINERQLYQIIKESVNKIFEGEFGVDRDVTYGFVRSRNPHISIPVAKGRATKIINRRKNYSDFAKKHPKIFYNLEEVKNAVYSFIQDKYYKNWGQDDENDEICLIKALNHFKFFPNGTDDFGRDIYTNGQLSLVLWYDDENGDWTISEVNKF